MPTFEEIIDEVMDAHKSRSKRTYIGCIGSAKALKKTFQNTDASKIVPDDFYSLHVKRLREENPKRNLNNDRKMFIRAMYISYRRGLIRTPPIRIPKPDLEKELGMSEKVLSQIYLHLNVEDLRESAEAVALP